MKIRYPLSILLLGACAFQAHGAWRISSTDEGSADFGRHVRVVAKETDSNEHAQLHLAIFDMQKTILRVIDQPNESRNDLATVMSTEHSLAGVNGGYFDPAYEPVGLLICNGRKIAPFRRARLLSGVLSVVNGHVRLQRAAEFSINGKIAEAVQCGPFLVDHARAVAGLDDSASAHRTFVAIGGHMIVLGYCSSLSLAQLSQLLTTGKITDDLRIERALNLDGGSSSAFWFARENGAAFSIPEWKPVRDFVAISPR